MTVKVGEKLSTSVDATIFFHYVSCQKVRNLILYAKRNESGWTLGVWIGDESCSTQRFKVDRRQIIVDAKTYIYVSQLFISRMPKMRAIPQLVSSPLNPHVHTLVCKMQALHFEWRAKRPASRPSFRVRLSRDFSRLPKWRACALNS